MERFLKHHLAPLTNRIMNMLALGVIKSINDSGGLQILQSDLLEGETKDDLERFQEYGFTSVPKSGAQSLVAFLGGNRGHGLVLCVVDSRYRKFGLENGDVCVYSSGQNHIILKDNGDIEIYAADDKTLRIDADNIQIHARSRLAIDAGGNGQVWTEDTRDDYVIGSTNTSHNLHPPEIP